MMIPFPQPESLDQNSPPDRSLFSRLLFDAGVDLINLEYELSKLDTLFQVLDRNSEDDQDQNFILCRFRVALSGLQDQLKIIGNYYSRFLDNSNRNELDGFYFVTELEDALRQLEEEVI